MHSIYDTVTSRGKLSLVLCCCASILGIQYVLVGKSQLLQLL